MRKTLMSLAIMGILAAFGGSFVLAASGKALPHGVLRGTFQEMTLYDPCSSVKAIGNSLTTTMQGRSPLFVVGVEAPPQEQPRPTPSPHGTRIVVLRPPVFKCDWEIATIAHGVIEPMAYFQGDLHNISVSDDADGSYWLAFDEGYARVASGRAQWRHGPYVAGFRPVGIVTLPSGETYSVETALYPAKTASVLVNLSRESVAQLHIEGTPQGFVLGSDGRMYLIVMDRACSILQVDEQANVYETTPCNDPERRAIAIDARGEIWQAGFAAIEVWAHSRLKRSIGGTGASAR